MKYILLKIGVLAALSLAAACGGIVEKLAPVRLESVEMHGLSGADVSFEIGNASAHRIRIRNAEATFHYDGIPIGTATLMREFTIERRKHDTLRTRWRLRVEEPAAARLLEKRIERKCYDKIAVSYTIDVRAGLAQKTFSAEMVPFSDFLTTFDRITETAP